MKIFYNYIKSYFKEDFSLITHILIGFFLVSTIFLNYYFDVYNEYFRASKYDFLSILKIFGFFCFAFFSSLIIISYFKKNKKPIANTKYILFGLIGLFFISLDTSYYLLKFHTLFFNSEHQYYSFIRICASNLMSLFSVIIPLFLIYSIVKYFRPELYGLRFNGAKIKPYFWLILLMIPLVYGASFSEDFLRTYPSFNRYAFNSTELPFWQKGILYELCYGFDFLSVELIFRGFMVVALSRFVGKDAILPMVVCYAFLHFGKPLGETIGSVFGGYILGIIAYKSRNIHGGLIVHLGVAWGMELTAYLAMK